MNKFNVELDDSYYFINDLINSGCVFQYFEDESFNGRTVKINDEEKIYLASCSYLGIEKHPKLVNAAKESLNNYGTQISVSRAMISSPLYAEIETKLAKIYPGNQVISQTVTLGHCSALPLLIDAKDAIILDAYVHNSVRMASQLCKANGTNVFISKHNNIEHLKYLIYRLKKDGYKNIWYCADGLYSMHGNFCDIVPLAELLDNEDNFFAYIDDSHSTGWYGKNGIGFILDKIGLHEKIITVVAFSKSISALGGALIIPDKEIADYVRHRGQTMIFSGPIQPPSLGALSASLSLHQTKEIEERQANLIDNIQYFRELSRQYNIPLVTNDITPIQLIRVNDVNKIFEISNLMRSRGFLVPTVTYPAIAKGDEGLRISITLHLTKNDLKNFIVNLSEIL